MEDKLWFHSHLMLMAQVWSLPGFSSVTLWQKQSSDVCTVALYFFPHYRWHGNAGLYSEMAIATFLLYIATVLHSSPLPQKLTVLPQIKRIPLPFPASSHHFLPLDSVFCLYITVSFTLAWGHLGLEINILSYCTLHSTVQNTKTQPLVEDAHVWQCTCD